MVPSSKESSCINCILFYRFQYQSVFIQLQEGCYTILSVVVFSIEMCL